MNASEKFYEACAYANATPALLSMLYDLGMMPEQVREPRDMTRFMSVVTHWRTSKDAGVFQPIPQDDAYAEQLREALEGVQDAIINGLKFDGTKWLLFESGRHALLDRIYAALAKNPNPAGHLVNGDFALEGEVSGPAGLGPDSVLKPINLIEPLTGRELAMRQRTPEEQDDNDLLRAVGDLAVMGGLWDGMVPLGGIPKKQFTAWARRLIDILDEASAAAAAARGEVVPRVVPRFDAFQWKGDRRAFEDWFGAVCPIDGGERISVPTNSDRSAWLRVWVGSWIIRHEGECYCVTDAVYRNFIAPNSTPEERSHG